MPQVGRHFTLSLELIKSAANERAVHKGHRKAKEPKDGRREKWVGGPEVMQDLRTKRN